MKDAWEFFLGEIMDELLGPRHASYTREFVYTDRTQFCAELKKNAGHHERRQNGDVFMMHGNREAYAVSDYLKGGYFLVTRDKVLSGLVGEIADDLFGVFSEEWHPLSLARGEGITRKLFPDKIFIPREPQSLPTSFTVSCLLVYVPANEEERRHGDLLVQLSLPEALKRAQKSSVTAQSLEKWYGIHA